VKLTDAGVAYVLSNQTWREVEVISSWVGFGLNNEHKCPSRIAYAAENDFEDDKWGDEVESGMTICQVSSVIPQWLSTGH
jgi:hypothetical protein